MKVACYTLGCKVNHYETQAMLGRFEAAGYEIVDYAEFADIYIVNTCSVTAVSDQKSRQALRRCKKINPLALVIAAGCFSQLSPDKAAAVDGVDVVLGSARKDQIVVLAEQALAEHRQLRAVTDIMAETAFEEFGAETSREHTRAYIKIQDGCDNYCAYCIIPYARGHARSRDWESIGREFDALHGNGFREVVLTGIEISTYRSGDLDLIGLLEYLNAKATIPRIRLGSLEPRLVTPEFVRRLGALSRLCPQFHLALQSGSDSVLRRMNRKYDTARYAEAVRLLRAIPHLSVTTDLIVGFPGETEAEFQEMLDFVKTIDFLKLHIFPYSRRAGTVADKLPNQIEKSVKAERAKRLEALGTQLRQAYLQQQLGQTLPVLFEERLAKGRYRGYTANYVPVTVCSEKDCLKQQLPVRLTALEEDGCLGELEGGAWGEA